MAEATVAVLGVSSLVVTEDALCPESAMVPCQGKQNKIFVCHYDDDTDAYSEICVSAQGALRGHIKQHHKDYCGRCSDHFDVDSDGVVDMEDLVGVLVAIDDPLGVGTPNDPKADLNGDMVVDFRDAYLMLAELITRFGAETVSPLTLNYNEEHVWDTNQGDIVEGSGIRFLVRRGAASNSARRPEPFSDEHQSSNFGKMTAPAISHRRLQSSSGCGETTVGAFTKGTGPRPSISWDNGYAHNEDAEATAADYWNWAYYGTLNLGAQVLLPDASEAYSNYRSNSGNDLQVDYQKAIDDDAAIRRAYEAHIARVLDAVRKMHDGSETSFSFHSNAADLVGGSNYPETENWQKAIGGHRIWTTGTVTYDEGSQKMTVVMTTEMEDFYNFNKGQVDIKTGLPDDDNGRFEVLGWAKSFFSTGSVTATKEITSQVECCTNEDCNAPEECVQGICIVEGNPRFTLSWYGDDDLDIHVLTPGGVEIYYVNVFDPLSGGRLDHDDIPETVSLWVENIAFPLDGSAPVGTYKYWVHEYSQRGGESDSWTLTVYLDDVEQESHFGTGTSAHYTFEATAGPREGERRLKKQQEDEN